MSLINAWCWADHAYIATDTDAKLGAQTMSVSKLFYLPHANLVLAGRGQGFFTQVVFSKITLSGCSCFDEANEILAPAIGQAADEVKAFEAQHPEQAMFDGRSQLVLLGYSHAKASFQLSVAELEKPRKAEIAVRQNHAVLMPWEPSWGRSPVSAESSRAELVRAMGQQAARLREFDSSVGTGGRIMLCEIDRSGASIRDVGTC